MSWAVSLASCLDRLDLQAAVAIVAKERNDLLPRRHEDLITENLGEDWTATISDEIRSHEYRPEPTQAVAVPKSRFSTRPAGVLPLKDRVVFEALVNPCREKVESILIDKNRVFWPRGVVAPSRWAEFEESPLKDGVTHIVLGDVAGFYESVDHAILRRLILDATGHLDLAEALSGFLTRTMGRDRGMPQGVAASDVLATLYLSPVDAAMMEQGLDFTRHGDDMRVAAKSYGEGLRVAHLMEHAMRRQKLLPNSSTKEKLH